jgi:hypothetical protein
MSSSHRVPVLLFTEHLKFLRQELFNDGSRRENKTIEQDFTDTVRPCHVLSDVSKIHSIKQVTRAGSTDYTGRRLGRQNMEKIQEKCTGSSHLTLPQTTLFRSLLLWDVVPNRRMNGDQRHLKIRAPRCLETSVSNHPLIRHNIRKDGDFNCTNAET